LPLLKNIKETFKLFLFHKKSLNTYNLFKNMANEQMNTPSGFGGLMRFNEEYESVFNLKPTHVIIFVIMIVAFRIGLEVIY
jgi:preprotein translocase subunit Sec61beta|tara:strand:- start:473 stop:715 length:243 start_codon:yes stop_codon:yes gene_type:complete